VPASVLVVPRLVMVALFVVLVLVKVVLVVAVMVLLLVVRLLLLVEVWLVLAMEERLPVAAKPLFFRANVLLATPPKVRLLPSAASKAGRR